jgi:hypothetical protein
VIRDQKPVAEGAQLDIGNVLDHIGTVHGFSCLYRF